MKLLEKILVATDFGPSASDAVRTAQVLAQTFGSKLILIHVMPNVPKALVKLRPLRMAVRERLSDLQNELAKADVSAVESVVERGVVFDRIVRASERLDVNVIVVGSGGQAEPATGRLGVTAERLVRKASKPVWVVKAGTAPMFKRMLCAVDFSDPARRALGNAIHLARSFRAELMVLHVSESLPELHAIHAVVAVEAQAKYWRQERQEFDAFLQPFDFSGITWTKVVRQGEAHGEILRCAGEWKPDLLVMGSVGRTGLSRILLGSVAGKVLREMPCSIITVKSEHAIRLQFEGEIADLEQQFKRGQELLKKGFPAEARREFERCLEKDRFYAPALDGLAATHQRLGHAEQSERYTQQAKLVRERMQQGMVEAAIRSESPLWKKR